VSCGTLSGDPAPAPSGADRARGTGHFSDEPTRTRRTSAARIPSRPSSTTTDEVGSTGRARSSMPSASTRSRGRRPQVGLLRLPEPANGRAAPNGRAPRVLVTNRRGRGRQRCRRRLPGGSSRSPPPAHVADDDRLRATDAGAPPASDPRALRASPRCRLLRLRADLVRPLRGGRRRGLDGGLQHRLRAPVMAPARGARPARRARPRAAHPRPPFRRARLLPTSWSRESSSPIS